MLLVGWKVNNHIGSHFLVTTHYWFILIHRISLATADADPKLKSNPILESRAWSCEDYFTVAYYVMITLKKKSFRDCVKCYSPETWIAVFMLLIVRIWCQIYEQGLSNSLWSIKPVEDSSFHQNWKLQMAPQPLRVRQRWSVPDTAAGKYVVGLKKSCEALGTVSPSIGAYVGSKAIMVRIPIMTLILHCYCCFWRLARSKLTWMVLSPCLIVNASTLSLRAKATHIKAGWCTKRERSQE